MAGKWAFAVICVLLARTNQGSADDVLPPLPGRYAAANVKESPDFRRHVLPVMSRMGCNAAACHGSFQGQGGFRLSLFGYDFKTDHDALTAGDQPRVNIVTPKASLILNKPTSADDHGGGLRFPKGSWQYNVFRRWIEDGAKGVEPDDAQFVRLTVTPTEIAFAKPGETAKIRVVATWSDGTFRRRNGHQPLPHQRRGYRHDQRRRPGHRPQRRAIPTSWPSTTTASRPFRFCCP